MLFVTNIPLFNVVFSTFTNEFGKPYDQKQLEVNSSLN